MDLNGFRRIEWTDPGMVIHGTYEGEGFVWVTIGGARKRVKSHLVVLDDGEPVVVSGITPDGAFAKIPSGSEVDIEFIGRKVSGNGHAYNRMRVFVYNDEPEGRKTGTPTVDPVKSLSMVRSVKSSRVIPSRPAPRTLGPSKFDYKIGPRREL